MGEECKIIQLKEPGLPERERILEFHNAGFPASNWSGESLDIFFDKKNKGICLVMEEGTEMVGLIIGKLKKNDPSCMTLSALLVDGKARGRGFAKELAIRFVEKTFKDKVADRIGLHFRDSNGLQNFYEKLGFGKHEVVGMYKNGEAKHYMEISK